MVLENEKCCVEIKADYAYYARTLEYTDNHYDVILNPFGYKRNEKVKTLSIHVDLFEKEFHLALLGPFYIYDDNCAVLEDEILSVLQGSVITQIGITDGTIIRHIWLNCFDDDFCAMYFAIYRINNGYVLLAETEITMVDLDFNKKWSFSGKGIFASFSGKHFLEISNNSICLYDFEKNYYEIDFNGNLLR